jgi:hypothetical protein
MAKRREQLLFDLAFVLFALAFALLVHHTAVSPESGGTRYMVSDAQSCAAFAAGLDHPELFARDPLLADAKNFGWNTHVHTRLIRWLAQGKDYGLAFAQLTGVHQFAHLIGFYLLGLCFIRQRWLAACFAVMVSLELWIGWGTFWGSLSASVPLPRVTYAALFALLCAAMLVVRRRYQFWPLIFLGMGALVHVHSISALGMGFAMWLGLWHVKPEGFTRMRQLTHMLLAGVCFVLPATPFIMNYLSYFAIGEVNRLSPEDMLFLRTVAEYRLEETLTHLGQQLWGFVLQMLTQPPLLPLALLGAWCTYRYGDDRERDLLPMLGLWSLGIILLVAVHALDMEIAYRLGRLPLGVELARVIRFMLFFFFVAAFMGFSIYWDTGILQVRFVWARWIPTVIAVTTLILFLLQGAVQPILFLVLPPSAKQVAIRAKERANGEFVRALDELTPPGSKIFLESEDQLVRYAALRNLAFAHKDGGILVYGKNVPGVRTWYPMALELGNPANLGFLDQGARKAENMPENKLTTLFACARKADADYLVVLAPADLPRLQKAGEIIWNNSHYVMLRLPQANSAGSDNAQF